MRNLKFTTIAAIMMALIWSPVYFGCGTNAAQKRTDTLKTLTVSANAARDAFVKWDLAHQEDIRKNSTDYNDFETKITAYHAKREPVTQGFVSFYSADAAALTINDDPSVQTAVAALSDVLKAIDAFKKAVGGS